tara:strand:- start:1389 stop:2744 length:1356 start_codon:yes stop_codon:yes gene_type:complete
MGDWDYAVEMGLEDLQGNIRVDDHDYYNYHDEINSTKNITESIKIELTPSKYLDSSSRYLRAQLTNNALSLDDITLELFHDKYNEHDPMAIEVYCKKLFIGYVKKKDGDVDIDNFCFTKGHILRDLTIIWKDNCFEISREGLSQHNDEERSVLLSYDPVEVKKLWDWADEKNIPEDIIPRDYENLEKLTELKIYERDLSFIPEEIGCLHNVTKMQIWSNKIELLPTSIGKLQNLTHLSIDGRNLKSLPEALAALQNLKNLKLCGLAFTDFPQQICKLINLESLIILDTKFYSLPSELCNLVQLKAITIRDSELREASSFLWLQALDKLESIHLCLVNLEFVPEQIGCLYNLKELVITDSRIEKIPDFIGELSNLNKLTISYNSELRALPDSIGNLTNLIEIDLNALPLATIPETLANLANVKKVTLCMRPRLPDCILKWINDNGIKAVMHY